MLEGWLFDLRVSDGRAFEGLSHAASTAKVRAILAESPQVEIDVRARRAPAAIRSVFARPSVPIAKAV